MSFLPFGCFFSTIFQLFGLRSLFSFLYALLDLSAAHLRRCHGYARGYMFVHYMAEFKPSKNCKNSLKQETFGFRANLFFYESDFDVLFNSPCPNANNPNSNLEFS